MGKDTTIGWTHHTFNAWWGCHKVSPGCEHCYAAAFDHRLGGSHWKLKGPRKFQSDKYWDEPLKWARDARAAGERRRVFCSSMADVFEDREDLIPHRERLWKLIKATPDLDWLLLTKRPENMITMVPWGPKPDAIAWWNVWLGTTVENQEYADIRIPKLLATSAAIRFLSMEPLLGPVDLTRVRQSSAMSIDALAGIYTYPIPQPLGARVAWVIVGCESGHGARPCEVEWLRATRDQCAAAGTPLFLKQAEHTPGDYISAATLVVGADTGSTTKKGKMPHGGLLVELPYLDGVQHAAFPVAA